MEENICCEMEDGGSVIFIWESKGREWKGTKRS